MSHQQREAIMKALEGAVMGANSSHLSTAADFARGGSRDSVQATATVRTPFVNYIPQQGGPGGNWVNAMP
jgi:hypothetical protein